MAYNFKSVEQVVVALAKADLATSSLIVGIDFSISNTWAGQHSFNGRSLHQFGDAQNPYEQVLWLTGRTLVYTSSSYFFFLAGSTSYVAIIEMAMAMAIVRGSVGKNNVLLIIGDSRVTRSVDTDSDKLSWFEQKDYYVWYLFLLWSCFICRLHLCREYPLSIIVVGVGDEPLSMMFSCRKNSSLCAYDNFKLCWVSVFSVCEFYMEIMSKDVHLFRKEIEFALAAFTEISQHKNLFASERVPLLPPIHISASLVSKSYFPEIQHRENTIHDESGPWFDRLEHECPISMISGYEGVIHIGNFPVPASFEALYKKIWEKHGHLATHNIIKTSTLTLVTLAAELLKDKSSASLLGKVDRQIEDAEALQFNVQWLRRHFEKVKKKICEAEKHC
ncbi:hypothetical protein MKX01_006663 [Papaver californicum]|nr:hypothetical protein MKX01_006663 [Papaver californicum]